MKITEQRIGNLVYGIYETETGETDQIICRVVAVDETESLGDGWSSIIQRIEDGPEIEEYEDTAPIPLTEEWLKRFGFVKCVDNSSWMEIQQFSVSSNGSVAFFLERKWVNATSKLEYVHQLQNLYYALTGQELTLSPPQR